MKLIQYEIKDRRLIIYGTNQMGDLFISALCFPLKGRHAGVYLATNKLMKELDLDSFDCIEGHSMGGSIGLEVAYRTGKPVIGQGPYPIFSKGQQVCGKAQRYGKDLVPTLFPWFDYGCPLELIPREGKGNCFSDHVRY